MYPFCTLKGGGGDLYNTYVSRDTQVSCQLVPIFISNKHNHLIGISNPEYQCYLNFVIQLLLPILRTIIYNFQFNTSAEGSLSIFLFQTAHGGQIQQDSLELLVMFREVISKDGATNCGSNDNNNCTGVSLSEIVFSFMLENKIDRDLPHLNLVVCYILYLLIPLPCRNWWCKKCNKNRKEHLAYQI